MECLLILPLNFIRNIDFLFFKFFEISRFYVLAISIFVVVKEHVVFCTCYKSIFRLFLVVVRHFLVYLSELFWSEFVRAAIFTMLLPFCFVALNPSIYLPAIYLPICVNEVICPSFLKAVLSAKTVPFAKTFYCEIQVRNFTNFIGLCRYILSSKIVKLDSQRLLLVPMS